MVVYLKGGTSTDRKEKLEHLMEESRQVFLNEQSQKLNEAAAHLLKCRLNGGRAEIEEMERFFHSLKGTGATLNFDKLSLIGNEYEEYLKSKNDSNGLTDRDILKILDGLALVYMNLTELNSNDEKVQGELTHKNADESLDAENIPIVSDDIKEEGDNTDSSNAKIVPSAEVKTKILIVDDVNAMVHLIQGQLAFMDFDVTSAKSGEEGIRKSRLIKPDLAIVDLVMPGIDGFEVCRQIKNSPETKHTKIMVISSKRTKSDVLKCFEIGVDDYIIKPFSMNQLEERINKLICKLQEERENSEKNTDC